MISVAELYNRVYLDVAVQDRSGYVTDEEVTRSINEMQRILFNFHRKEGNDRELYVFTKTETAEVSGDIVTLPEDFSDVQAVYVDAVLAKGCSSEVKPITYQAATPSEFRRARHDAILKPSFEKSVGHYTYGGGSIRIAPAGNKVNLDYYRLPANAKIVLTANIDDIQTVDESESINLEWPQDEQPNFVTLLLASLGIEQRESALIQYYQSVTAAKQSIQS